MGLIIVIIDGGVTVEKDADTIDSYPSGTTSLAFNNGAITSKSEITPPFIIKSNDTVANQVDSIDDNRTGGAGSIVLPVTVRLLHDFLNPFFFRVTPIPESSIKGGYNAATNTPDLDTTPIAVKKGDLYVVTVSGTFFTEAVESGDSLISLIDNPTLLSDWIRTEGNNDYTFDRVLSLGNTTGANVIEHDVNDGKIRALGTVTGGIVGEYVGAGFFYYDTDNNGFTKAVIFGSQSVAELSFDDSTLRVNGDGIELIANGAISPGAGKVFVSKNIIHTTTDFDNFNSFISTRNATDDITKKNSVVIGGTQSIDASNTAYADNIKLKVLGLYASTPAITDTLHIPHKGYVDASKWMNLNVILGTAKTHYVVVPFGTTLKRISTVIFGTTATAPETITTKNNAGTAITNGVVTIATGAIAKEVDTAVPTANNTFATNDVLTVEVLGENTNAVECELTFEFSN